MFILGTVEGLPILTMITGPGGTLIVLTLLVYGIYSISNRHFIPMAKEYIEKQGELVKELMQEHKEDRTAFFDSIKILAQRQDKLEIEFKEVKSKLEIEFKEVKDNIVDIKQSAIN